MQKIRVHENTHLLNIPLPLGAGTLIDFLAGVVVRARAGVRRATMETVWRLAQKPHRLVKRYLAGDFTFLARMGKRAADFKRAARRNGDCGAAHSTADRGGNL